MPMPDFRNQTAHHRVSPPTSAEAWDGNQWVPGKVMTWVKDPSGWWAFFWPGQHHWRLNGPVNGWLPEGQVRAVEGDAR